MPLKVYKSRLQTGILMDIRKLSFKIVTTLLNNIMKGFITSSLLEKTSLRDDGWANKRGMSSDESS